MRPCACAGLCRTATRRVGGRKRSTATQTASHLGLRQSALTSPSQGTSTCMASLSVPPTSPCSQLQVSTTDGMPCFLGVWDSSSNIWWLGAKNKSQWWEKRVQQLMCVACFGDSKSSEQHHQQPHQQQQANVDRLKHVFALPAARAVCRFWRAVRALPPVQPGCVRVRAPLAVWLVWRHPCHAGTQGWLHCRCLLVGAVCCVGRVKEQLCRTVSSRACWRRLLKKAYTARTTLGLKKGAEGLLPVFAGQRGWVMAQQQGPASLLPDLLAHLCVCMLAFCPFVASCRTPQAECRRDVCGC